MSLSAYPKGDGLMAQVEGRTAGLCKRSHIQQLSNLPAVKSRKNQKGRKLKQTFFSNKLWAIGFWNCDAGRRAEVRHRPVSRGIFFSNRHLNLFYHYYVNFWTESKILTCHDRKQTTLKHFRPQICKYKNGEQVDTNENSVSLTEKESKP